MSLNSSEIQEVLGRVKVQAILEPFLTSSSDQKRRTIVNWPLGRTIELGLEFFHNIVKPFLGGTRAWDGRAGCENSETQRDNTIVKENIGRTHKP